MKKLKVASAKTQFLGVLTLTLILTDIHINLQFFLISIKNVSFSGYLGFYVLDESTNFKICDVIIDITAYKLQFRLFLYNPK